MSGDSALFCCCCCCCCVVRGAGYRMRERGGDCSARGLCTKQSSTRQRRPSTGSNQSIHVHTPANFFPVPPPSKISSCRVHCRRGPGPPRGLVQWRSSTLMPRHAHSDHAMPGQSMVIVYGKATSSRTPRPLVRVFVDPSPRSINGSVPWLVIVVVAALRLEDGRLVEDALIFCRVELHEECLPLLNELTIGKKKEYRLAFVPK